MKQKVLVNGADYSGSVLVAGLEIQQNITDRVSTASITFRSHAGEPSRYDESNYDLDTYGIDVRELYEVRIENKATGQPLFAGSIRSIKPVRKNQTTVFYECECQDWSTILDETYIELENFEGLSDRAVIQVLVNKYTRGQLTATTANIASVVFLTLWEVREKTLRQALDEIVEFSGADWKIDCDKNLLYFLPTQFPAPFGLSSTPNSIVGQIGLIWDEATETWQSTTDTWDEVGELPPAESTTLTWNELTRTWDEATDITWDSPGQRGLITYGIDAFLEYDRDAIRIINRCTVLGAVLFGGHRLRVVYDDPISQLSYGVRAHTIVDDQMAIGAIAMLRAKSVVDDNAFPRETISLKTFIDGLEVGQSLPIVHNSHFLNGTYIIRELRIRQLTRTITEYSITAGARPPDTLRLLRTIDARMRRNTGVPVARPADGSVTDASIGPGGLTADVIESVNANSIFGDINANQIGSVNATSIFGQISAGQIGSVSAAVIAGVITAEQISTVSAGSIQGVITAGQIGSINATTIQGVIISSQVTDGLFDRLALFSDSLRPIPSSATFPPLPDINYPLNSTYYNTTNGFFYKNTNDAWVLVPEGTAVSGKLEYYHIGTIKAQSIIGVILAAQIGTITAGQITGQITASQIATVNASAITGSISSTQIGSVNAGAIQGTITSGQIASVNATAIAGLISAAQIGTVAAASITGLIQAAVIQSVFASAITGTITSTQIGSVAANTITGTLTSTQIGSVNASSITGTLTASQIASVNAGSITGTISSTQIGSINAATITIGLIGNSQIGGMAAGKLTAGTIDASVISVTNINAANITTGTISASRIGAGTISAAISITSPTITGGNINGVAIQIGVSSGQVISISGAGSFVYDSLGATEFHTKYLSTGIIGVANTATRFVLDRAGGGGRLQLYDSSNVLAFEVSANFGITAPTASSGSSTLPASPAGFMNVTIAGASKKIPYYNG